MTTKHSQLYEQTIMIDDILKVIETHLDWCESEARNAAIENDEDYEIILEAERKLEKAYSDLMKATEEIEEADQFYAFPF